MKSNDPSELLDLERDLPTTAEDVAALRLAARSGVLTLSEYLDFLAAIPPSGETDPRRRRDGGEPFELPIVRKAR